MSNDRNRNFNRILHESTNSYHQFFDFENKIVQNRYLIKHRIGYGSFGEIFIGLDIFTNEKVAIKFQQDAKRTYREYYLMEIAFSSKNPSSPKPIAHFVYHSFYVIVMELLGPSLDELFVYCHCKFSLTTILRIAYSALYCCERIHANGVVHRDIQPKNFVMGTKDLSNKLYIIDFGLADKWRIKRDHNFMHIPYYENENFTGTVQYSSLNAHLGIHQTRRDDLESLGFVLMYFNRGNLPWQGIRHCNRKQKNERICEMKMSICIKRLCKGYPSEFMTYLNYCRSLGYEETPNYAYLRFLFQKLLLNKHNLIYDWILRYREIEYNANNKYQIFHFEISNWIEELKLAHIRKTYV